MNALNFDRFAQIKRLNGDVAVLRMLVVAQKQGASPQDVVAMAKDVGVGATNLARLKAQITAQEVKLAALRGYMTESNPDVTRAQQELAALRFQLSRSEQNDSQKPGSADAEYVAKFRDFKYQETLYELMARQTELAKLDEARDGAVIQVVDVALPPERKSKPRKAMIATVTTLVTFLLMLVVVFIKQALRNAQDDAVTSSKLAKLRAYLRP